LNLYHIKHSVFNTLKLSGWFMAAETPASLGTGPRAAWCWLGGLCACAGVRGHTGLWDRQQRVWRRTWKPFFPFVGTPSCLTSAVEQGLQGWRGWSRAFDVCMHLQLGWGQSRRMRL